MIAENNSCRYEVLPWVFHFPIGIPGHVCYLNVSIPDLCTLLTLKQYTRNMGHALIWTSKMLGGFGCYTFWGGGSVVIELLSIVAPIVCGVLSFAIDLFFSTKPPMTVSGLWVFLKVPWAGYYFNPVQLDSL